MDGWWVYIWISPMALFLIVITLLQIKKHMDTHLFSLNGLLYCSFFIIIFRLLELISLNDQMVTIFSKITYPFISVCPVFWFLFSIEITTGRYSLIRHKWLLYIIPFLTSFLFFTNDLHNLIWKRYEIVSFLIFKQIRVLSYGFYFWIHVFYSYMLYSLGSIIIITSFILHHQIFRLQALWVLLGGLLPLIFNVLYVFRIGGLTFDFSPLVLALSSLFFYIGIKNTSLAFIHPFSRILVYSEITDPLIIVNKNNIIVDINLSAKDYFGSILRVGKNVQEVFEKFPFWIFQKDDFSSRIMKLEWSRNSDSLETKIRISPLRSNGYSIMVLEEKGPSVVFTRREKEILELLGKQKNLTNKEIARHLNIDESTVKTHIHNLLRKTKRTKRSDLVNYFDEEEG